MRIGVVVGNPKPLSRTYALASRLAREVDGHADLRVVDLVDYKDTLFEPADDDLDSLVAEIAGQDVLVVASPTYKATYTGLLKAFFDRFPHRGLAGVICIPVMTNASEAHSMAADVHLRPLLVELGAVVPTESLAVPTPYEGQLDRILSEWLERNDAALQLIRRTVPVKAGGHHD
jgi:FMN reductase